MRVLYLGEGELAGPARYLAAVLQWSKLPFDHRPDETPIPRDWWKRSYDLFILSDYRAASFSAPTTRWMINQVREKGVGFLMIGGWASFTGLVGGYAGHPLEDLLPVRCVPGDDRVNRAAVLSGVASKRPIIVCGYHRARVKSGAVAHLHFRELAWSNENVVQKKLLPALVTGRAGRGRTAAFLTDSAPHWAGGLVDWGDRRITLRTSAGVSVEVGDGYLLFFQKLFATLARSPKAF